MRLVGSMRPVVVEICWCCSGTGKRLAAVSPMRFKPCPVCYGRRGRQISRGDVQDVVSEISARRASRLPD